MTFWGVKVIADVIPRSIRGTERYVIKATRCNWESLRKDYFNCSVCLAIMFANWYFSLGLNKVWQDEREINNQMKLWLPEGKPKSIIFPLIFIQIGFPVGVSTHKGVLPPILRLNHYKAVKNTTPETRVSIPQNSPWKGENKVEPKKKWSISCLSPKELILWESTTETIPEWAPKNLAQAYQWSKWIILIFPSWLCHIGWTNRSWSKKPFVSS